MRKETALLISLLALAVGFFAECFWSLQIGRARRECRVRQSAVERELQDRIAALQKETAQDPANAAAWIELGNAYFDTDQYEKSIQAYRRALDLKPDNADVWTTWGHAAQAGRSQDAVKAFDQAIAVNPKHEVSRLNKGIVLFHDLQDTAGALRAWEGLLEINPTAMAPAGVGRPDGAEPEKQPPARLRKVTTQV